MFHVERSAKSSQGYREDLERGSWTGQEKSDELCRGCERGQ